MKVRIPNLDQIVIIPDSDLEKLIVDSWYGKKGFCNFTINNAGMNHPNRYVTLDITFRKEITNE